MHFIMPLTSNDILLDSLEKFKQFTKRPEKYLTVQNDLADEIKQFVKTLYDFTKAEEGPLPSKSNALPELIIDGFDDEQIWQELELQNNLKCDQFLADVALLIARKDKLKFPVKLKCHELEESVDGENDKADSSSREEGEDNDNDGGDVSDSSNIEEEHEEGVGGVEKKNERRNKFTSKLKSKPSVVDDQFFKLRDLEQFLNSEDKKEDRRQKSISINTSEDESDFESIDYFEDISSEDTDEEGEDKTDPLYADFFDTPDGEEKTKQGRKRKMDIEEDDDGDGADEDGDLGEAEEEEDGGGKGDRRVRFNLTPASDSESSVSEKDGNEEDKGSEIKSSYEARQQRLKSHVARLEEEAVGEKPWQLKGEVSSTARPHNSLLEEVVEFDLTTRPAPVVTEKTTLKLEDIIRQRIKDRVWDDVERKVKPVQTPSEYKKKLVMDQEKSKQSLAEVYEQEYIKQREALNPNMEEKPEEESPKHLEVRTMMTALFLKLDALSNFHYTPKPAAPDVKVISNVPAISMEEVAPLATSDAALLAPEEVKAKPKGDVMSKGERTSTDKKRERRRKKTMQRHRQKDREQRERVVQKLQPGLGNKYSKERATELLERVTKNSNVEQMEDKGADKGVRSSAAFFARLQDEVSSHIKSKTQRTKKNAKGNVSAKRIKL